MTLPPDAFPAYDPNAVPAAIRSSEVTSRNQKMTGLRSLPWTAWKVAYDFAAQNNQVTGKRAHRA